MAASCPKPKLATVMELSVAMRGPLNHCWISRTSACVRETSAYMNNRRASSSTQ